MGTLKSKLNEILDKKLETVYRNKELNKLRQYVRDLEFKNEELERYS